MKKIILVFLTLALLIDGSAGFAFAQSATPSSTPVPTNEEKNKLKEKIREFKKVFQEERKINKKQFKEEQNENKKEFKLDLKNLRLQISGKIAKIVNAEVTEVSNNTLKISKDGKVYTVSISSNTKVRRHFWGNSSINEYSVGNKVNILGTWVDDAKTTIAAKLIRNLSIMKRHGVFIGDVISKDSTSFAIKSQNRGNQTINFDSNTKFVNRIQNSISYSDIKVGDRVRVKGLWDKSLNKVIETSQVKDFSIPTPTPTSI